MEIKLILNNTDYIAISDRGIGYTDFAATIFFSLNTGVFYLDISIYTCKNESD